jgi:hypothetical protein
MMCFIPGVALVYMGQEFALEHRPELFEKDVVDWAKGDSEFREWFGKVLAFSKKAKGEAPDFSWKELGRGVFLMERRRRSADIQPSFAVLVDLEGWRGSIELPSSLKGRDATDGLPVAAEGKVAVPGEPLLVEVES